MAVIKVLFIWYTCHLLLLKAAQSKCQSSFPCKNYTLDFPFTHTNHTECGLLPVDGCDDQNEHPRVQVGDRQLQIIEKISENTVLVDDLLLRKWLNDQSCLALSPIFNISSPSVSFSFRPNITLFRCFHQPPDVDQRIYNYFNNGYYNKDCEYSKVYYNYTPPIESPPLNITGLPEGCSVVQLPKSDQKLGGLFNLLEARYNVTWHVSEACLKCLHGGGQCISDNANKFYCKQGSDTHKTDSLAAAEKSRLKLILALSVSGAGLLLLLSISYIIWLSKKKSIGGYPITRSIASSHSAKPDSEGDPNRFFFGIPVFSYTELQEATNNFDSSKELGDGGFGTVYHGKLLDGREVAIKRLHEHNFKRVERFLNEIMILTSLRHPNLVSLYGCTSKSSRELLLVYEYVSNGTVFDHLHGKTAKEAPLSWPVRMSIAIETATALAYLHKSDIIHRDVKTNNILLDSNFSVKVADFGLSRLFPNDVTHISTVPQGTPGYVDPEYNQFYKLTDKSDVYSFGVVLIELISSMLAVDVSRHGHEINLANLALNRIQICAFDELIDPSLGYDSDPEVTRMTTTVAELAFRCLQADKDLRPSMEEVLTFLKYIKGGEDCNGGGIIKERNGDDSKTDDEVVLLKNIQTSPTGVTETWATTSTTTSSIA